MRRPGVKFSQPPMRPRPFAAAGADVGAHGDRRPPHHAYLESECWTKRPAKQDGGTALEQKIAMEAASTSRTKMNAIIVAHDASGNRVT